MKKSTRIIVLTACVLILAGFIFCGIAIARGADIRQMLRDGDFSINTADLNMDLGISVADGQFGGVRARRLVCERLTISTVSGEAEIEGGMESLRYSSTSGGMRADGLPEGCAVETDTVSGNMELRFDGCPGDIEADSTSGSVTVYLPGDVGFELDYDSVSGDLDCDFPSLREVYGDSVMFSMDVSTTSGDLDIRKN